MKSRMILGIIMLSILSSLVFADGDDAPPALPSEYWGGVTNFGSAAADGLAIVAEVNGVDYTQGNPVTFNNGVYNIMSINGDRPLTYNDDSDCSDHWNRDPPEACIQCTPCQGGNCVLGYNENTCIEGPQDGAIINIKINGVGVMPSVDWLDWLNDPSIEEEVDIVTPIGDWSKDGCVDGADFGFYANHYGEICPQVHPLPLCRIYDLILDGEVDGADFGPFANHYGEGCGG